MNLATKLSLILPTLLLAGCVIPLPDKVSAGHRYKAEAIAFLDLPGTTRDEVVKTLGQPYYESADTRTFLYEWEQTRQYAVSYPECLDFHDADTDASEGIVSGATRKFALFIAFDDRGFVTGHQVRMIGNRSLEEACNKWSGGLDSARTTNLSDGKPHAR